MNVRAHIADPTRIKPSALSSPMLAKPIAETKGMFWAWCIHFLQDVIIYTVLFLVAL